MTRSSRPAAAAICGDARAAGDAALVGDGVAALVELDAAQFGDVAVLDVDQAGGDAAAEDALGGLRHGGSGLACADHVDIAEAREVAAREVAGDGVGRVGRGERGAEDGIGRGGAEESWGAVIREAAWMADEDGVPTVDFGVVALRWRMRRLSATR